MVQYWRGKVKKLLTGIRFCSNLTLTTCNMVHAHTAATDEVNRSTSTIQSKKRVRYDHHNLRI